MKLTVDELPYGFLRISDGTSVLYSSDFNFSVEHLTAYWMCGDKHLTSLLLQAAGIPVPAFQVFDRRTLASAFASFDREIKVPLVVKPCFGAGGDGISVGIRTYNEFRRACYQAAVHADRIMVEEFVTGRHWRITVFDGKLVFACERMPASVVGDGQSSIRTLVRRRNEAIVERDGFHSAYPIQIDKDTHAALRDQNLTPASVPSENQQIILKRICNAAVGGMTHDVSDNLHPDYLCMAQQAAATMGARLAGVDIIAPDVRLPLAKGAVFVNEVNTTPDLLLNHFDVSGSGDAVATVGKLLAMMFNNSSRFNLDSLRVVPRAV